MSKFQGCIKLNSLNMGEQMKSLLELIDNSGTISLITPRKHYMSCIVRKPTFCICENKDADQLRGNREADLRLCFRYINSSIPLLSKSQI